MHPAVTCTENEDIRAIAERIVTKSVNHIVVVDAAGKLRGIVTSWDITRAMAEGKKALADIETHNVSPLNLMSHWRLLPNGWRSTTFQRYP